MNNYLNEKFSCSICYKMQNCLYMLPCGHDICKMCICDGVVCKKCGGCFMKESVTPNYHKNRIILTLQKNKKKYINYHCVYNMGNKNKQIQQMIMLNNGYNDISDMNDNSNTKRKRNYNARAIRSCIRRTQ